MAVFASDEQSSVEVDLARWLRLARLHRGAREDDAVDVLALQRLHRERHREIALAGSGRPDRERDGV